MSDEQVNYSEDTWLSQVLYKNKEHYRDDIAYEFNGGKRKFLSTDRYDTGIYDGT